MPFIRVTVDGEILTSVATDGREVIAVDVGGTRVDEAYAEVSVSAGVYSTEVGKEHRIWIDQRPLRCGQLVEVALLESDTPIGGGRTIEDIYPQSEAASPRQPTDLTALFAELRSRTTVRDGYILEFTTSHGQTGRFVTETNEHGFGFSVLWNNLHPSRASVSLHAYTIDDVEKREPGRSAFREYIELGTHAGLGLIG
jgi:hypothetical protein